MLNAVILGASLLLAQIDQQPAVAPPADPAPPAAAPAPAPSTPDQAQALQKEVSTLNGQLVPVGEKNRYLTTFDRFNVSTNPIGYIYGSFTLGGAVALHRNIALRTDLQFYKNYFGDGWSVGGAVGLPIYFRKVWSGFFIQPGARVSYVNAENTDLVAGGPETLLGWHWIWDSGLNVALAAGVQFTFLSGDVAGLSLGSNGKGILPTGYLQIGKTF